MRVIRTFAAALLLTAMGAPIALADDNGAGHIDFDLRGVLVAPEASIKVAEHGTALPGSGSITDSYIPEVDATYFVTNHFGVELIAGTTQHSVHFTTGDSRLDLGSIWLLPPTVTAKYYFDSIQSLGSIRPYLGAGVNYTLFYSARSGAVPDMKYGNNWGTAIQAGADIPVGNGPYFLNVDVKQLFLNDSVKADGGIVRAHAVINPLLFGIGVGIRF